MVQSITIFSSDQTVSGYNWDIRKLIFPSLNNGCFYGNLLKARSEGVNMTADGYVVA